MKDKNALQAFVATSANSGAVLRQMAEEIVGDDAPDPRESPPLLTPEAMQQALHELRVHQIELEMQNEELQQERARVEVLAARYTELYDFAPVGYFSLDREGVIRQANLRGARLLGLDRSNLMQQRFGLFVAESDRPAFSAFLQKEFAGAGAQSCELGLCKGGDASMWVRIEATASEDGQECRAVVLDLSERRQAEAQARAAVVETQRLLALSERSRRALLSAAEDQEAATRALRDSEQRFRGLVEQSLTGIYISQDGAFLYANPRLEEVLGYRPGELVGVRADDIVIAEDLPIMQAKREALRAGATTSNYEVRARRKDGAIIELGVQGRVLESRGVKTTIGMAQDITEKKRAEEEIQRHIARLKAAFAGTVDVTMRMSEMRDPYTAGHERRVSEIAAAIGAELGLEAQATEGLRVAGQLHDVGKIAVPAEILAKPGKLSAIELRLIREHPQAGYDVLAGVEFPWPVAQVALQHHERMDGSGYPQGLKGEAILLEARIMAVADVVEAMSSHRPYRPGLGIGKALAEIERGRGTAYDPAVADACLKLFREKEYALPA